MDGELTLPNARQKSWIIFLSQTRLMLFVVKEKNLNDESLKG